MRDRDRVNSGLKTLSVAKSGIFSGKVATVVAKGGSLFPQLRGSIGESGRQKVHRTEARARFPLENVKKSEGLEALLEDEADKMCTTL